MPLTLMSPAFPEGGAIPRRYTRDGENVSPPMKWSGVPDGAKSLVLVMEDPDAPSGTFRHWAVFDIEPDRDGLPEAEGGKPGPGAPRQARNDFGNTYYDGPQPPRGHGVHHYHFRLAALDIPCIGVAGNVDIGRLWREAQRHALEEAELVGTYERNG